MIYTVKDHGDIVEKAAAQLIGEKFPNYELVWQTYVGNKGNNTIAELPNYPNEGKRKDFAEHSYTVLESAFIINQILSSKTFENNITNFDEYIEFNKAFISLFALLGRMHDTVIKASDILKYNNKNFIESIHKFYEARSIVIHGKKVPLIFDELGLLKIPVLKTDVIDGIAWDDKRNLWDEANDMESGYVVDTLTKFFYELLSLINNEYAVFYHIIQNELKELKTKLLFKLISLEILATDSLYVPPASGSTTITPVDVYGFKKR